MYQIFYSKIRDHGEYYLCQAHPGMHMLLKSKKPERQHILESIEIDAIWKCMKTGTPFIITSALDHQRF
jgi:hypothetical protein